MDRGPGPRWVGALWNPARRYPAIEKLLRWAPMLERLPRGTASRFGDDSSASVYERRPLRKPIPSAGERRHVKVFKWKVTKDGKVGHVELKLQVGMEGIDM